MNLPLPMALVAVLASAACAPHAPGQYGERACATVAALPTGAQLHGVGGVGDWSMSTTATVMTCGEPTPDGWGCVFSGPASVRVASSDASRERLYAIADGEMGAVTVSSSGVSCTLRSAQ